MTIIGILIDHVDWNTAMKLAGENFAKATIAFNRATISIKNLDEANQITADLLAELESRNDFFEAIFQDHADDIGNGWRREVIHHVMGGIDDAIYKIKKDSAEHLKSRRGQVLKLG